jgi:hypothetical protein
VSGGHGAALEVSKPLTLPLQSSLVGVPSKNNPMGTLLTVPGHHMPADLTKLTIFHLCQLRARGWDADQAYRR